MSKNPFPPNEFRVDPILGHNTAFRGMNTTTTAAFLPPGKMALSVNMRSVTGNPVVRLPLITTGHQTGTFYGAAEFLIDGVPTLLMAIGPAVGTVGGKVTCYKSEDSGATWAAITPPTGPYGDTRFTGVLTQNAPGSRIEFQVVKDRVFQGNTAFDVLVMQNGVDAPREYAKSANGAPTRITSTVYQPPIPATGANLYVETRFDNFLLVNDAGSTTYANPTIAGIKLSDSAVGAGSNTIFGQIFPAAVAGNNSSVTFNAPMNMGLAKQLIMLIAPWASQAITGATNAAPIVITSTTAHNLQTGARVAISGVQGNLAANGTWSVTVLTSTTFSLDNSVGSGAYTAATGVLVTNPDPNILRSLKVAISDGTNSMVLYDPIAGVGNPTFRPREIEGFLALTLCGYEVLLQPSPAVNMAAINRVIFTYQGQGPAVEIDFQVYVIAASGVYPGGTQFAASYYASDSRAMGDAQAYPAPAEGSVAQNGGLNTVSGSLPSPNIPTIADDEAFSYDYFAVIPNTPSVPAAAGIDTGLLFSQEPGQTTFYLSGSRTLVSWSGSAWVYTNSTTSNDGQRLLNATQDLSWPALDPVYQCMPTGLAMTASTQRLFVGQDGPRLWFSGAERPFQFRMLVASDLNGVLLSDSPGSFGIDGETIKSLLDVGAQSSSNETQGSPPNGVSTIYVLTDRTLTWVTGWDAISLTKRNLLHGRGTYAPKSLAPSRTGFFFVDTDGLVQRVDNMMVRPVSRDIVDATIQAVPLNRIPWMWGCVRQDRYYLAYSTSGIINQRALIYDVHESERIGEHFWLSDLFPGSVSGASALLAFRDGQQTLFVGMDAVGQAFTYETYGQTADTGASGVAWSLTFPELKGDMWQSVQVRRAGVVCDVNMGVLTTTRTAEGRLAPTSTNGSIATDAAAGITGTRAVRWDGNVTFPGLLANSVLFSISGTSPSGSRLYAVNVELAGASADGPDTWP